MNIHIDLKQLSGDETGTTLMNCASSQMDSYRIPMTKASIHNAPEVHTWFYVTNNHFTCRELSWLETFGETRQGETRQIASSIFIRQAWDSSTCLSKTDL